ncbi:MFS transporter [Actinomadura kijaniata]|uniref:MFS family permease n=1 Tax=Actinomadura namibiensis TaxID=182080 RepID=A0A7W3QKE9_ACTNM|nr:MFS transporter [Actinomadura namibiensis]MBA8950459.1 MFS family permease [Actinomadura namibiensis]
MSRSPSRPGPLLVALCLAQTMLVLDVVVVTVALPAMRAGLGMAEADQQWIVTAYGLAYGGFMIVAGRAGDLYGHRRVLVTGLVAFTAASLLAGAAPNAPTLVAARAAQGLGAALVSPAALALLTTTFAEGPARNRALGIWGAVASGGVAAAGLVGGLLTDLLHWRAIFLVNLPVGLLAVGAVLALAPAARPARAARPDLAGAALLTSGAVLLAMGLSGAALPLAAAPVLLAAFWAVQLRRDRRGADPLVKPALLANAHVRHGNLICAFTASAALVTQYFGTLYLQNAAGLSPLGTGLVFAPVTLVIVLISGRAAGLMARFGARALLLGGAAVTALGLVLLALAPAFGGGWAMALPGLLLSGAGSGLSFAPSMAVATTGVADDDQGLASGLLNTAFQLGAPLGLAATSAVAVAAAGPDAPADGYRAAFWAALALPALAAVMTAALPRPASAGTPVAPDRRAARRPGLPPVVGDAPDSPGGGFPTPNGVLPPMRRGLRNGVIEPWRTFRRR